MKKLNEEQLVQEMTPEQAAKPVEAAPAEVQAAQAPAEEAPAPTPEEAPAVQPATEAPAEEPIPEDVAPEAPEAPEVPEVAASPVDEVPAGMFKAPVEGMVPSGWIFPEEMAAAVAMETGDVEAAGTAPDAVVQPSSEVAAAAPAEEAPEEDLGGELQLESVMRESTDSWEALKDRLEDIWKDWKDCGMPSKKGVAFIQKLFTACDLKDRNLLKNTLDEVSGLREGFRFLFDDVTEFLGEAPIEESVEDMDSKLDALIKKMRAADKKGNKEEVEKCRLQMLKLLSNTLQECDDSKMEEDRSIQDIINDEALEPGEAHPEDRDDLDDILAGFEADYEAEKAAIEKAHPSLKERKMKEAEEILDGEEIGEPVEEIPSVDEVEAANEAPAEDICPECGKSPCKCKEGEVCVCEDGECECEALIDEEVAEEAAEEFVDDIKDADDPSEFIDATAEFLKKIFGGLDEDEPEDEELEAEEPEDEEDFAEILANIPDEDEEEPEAEEEFEEAVALKEDIFYPAGSSRKGAKGAPKSEVAELEESTSRRREAFNRFSKNLESKKTQKSNKLYRDLLNESVTIEPDEAEDNEDSSWEAKMNESRAPKFSWKDYLKKYSK